MESDNPDAVKPRRKRRRREPMPEVLRERAAKAARVHAKRYPAPEVEVVPSGMEAWDIASPFRSSDEEDWWRLLGEAFGTRSKMVVAVFLDQLAGLVSRNWDPEASRWMPEEHELQAVISIVAALKPKNEAEAAHAAQLVAVHLATMKVGKEIAERSSVDPRQANALANLVKAYSGGLNTMRGGRGRSTIRQVIKVERHVTINDNRSVHLRGGGAASGNRRDTAEGTTRARGGNSDTPCNGGTGVLIEGTALPSPAETLGGTMPGACGEGSQDMPDALRQQADRA